MSKFQILTGEDTLRGSLKPGFLYGAASASYQIEGGFDADGKGLNNWDVFLKDQENGEVACDSYHLWKEDIRLLKQYGCNTYRFSIAWARIRPLGECCGAGQTHWPYADTLGGRNDPMNEAGIKYYSDLVSISQGGHLPTDLRLTHFWRKVSPPASRYTTGTTLRSSRFAIRDGHLRRSSQTL
jgi:beta-glucosidase/6-phospho-beta-glucosidase/beta-galactosidase